MKQLMKYGTITLGLALTLLGTTATGEQVGITTSKESLKQSLSPRYPGKVYSPYAQRKFPSRPLWGDSHLHTGYSMDAGLFGNRLLLEEAYRFARGEEVISSTGLPVKLARPLDWLVIADHSDQMGMVQDIAKGDPAIMKSKQGRRWNAGMKAGGQKAVETTFDLITNFSQGTFDPYLVKAYAPGSPKYNTVWQKMVKTAERYNEPGLFTALIGYEWTSLVKGGNMHRNVIFRDGADKAGKVVPYTMTKPLGSTNPLDLYKWLKNYERKTGGSVLAIAHNGNLSNGIMFPVDRQYTGRKIDKKYVKARAKWEPLYEVTQIKGDGEAHPFLSPNDEFADFDSWDQGNLDATTAKTNDMLQYEYAREALKNGLKLEKKLGTNPYKFGMIGSTDSHTSLTTSEEDNFMGKHPGFEASAKRLTIPFHKTDKYEIYSWQMASAGLAAVWATENTREAIFDAMKRKETYATTGTRMAIRFFGGWNFTADDLNSRQPAFRGYEKGVPMGGDLRKRRKGKAPTFMVYALRDPIGANLDRIQIVKGWTDRKGKTHEKVYNVAWSGGRKLDSKGKLPAVGNTVNVKAANWTNSIGASELATIWTDPNFNSKERAFYYARVMEIPTPRWIVYDAFRYGTKIPKGATTIHQERGYTSPIWYAPN